MSFAQGAIPDVDDAEALRAWEVGADPLRVVLPLAISAAWAYADERAFATVMKRRGLAAADATFVSIANDAMFVCARAYVQPVGDGAVVSFRGTEPTNLINWLADGSLQRVAFHTKEAGAPHGWVHGGFYRNARAVWPGVVEALAAIDPKWIYITGHSFGGAVAVLAGAMLQDYAAEKHQYGDLYARLRGVFTFGQPMVGDASFAATYKGSLGQRLFRFVYDHDIVPHLPPDTNGWSPEHFGDEYRAASDGRWEKHTRAQAVEDVLKDSILGIAAWFKEQLAVVPGLKLPYSWGDHAPNHYVRISLPAGAESGSEFD